MMKNLPCKLGAATPVSTMAEEKEDKGMVFPKPIMSTAELLEMGFTKWELNKYAHAEGQTYAVRIPGGRKLRWDTAKFARALMKNAAR